MAPFSQALAVTLDGTPYIKTVPASSAVSPFAVVNGVKVDALGRIVIAG